MMMAKRFVGVFIGYKRGEEIKELEQEECHFFMSRTGEIT